MEKYLQNELVEFIPLFNIDYNIKKDLLSCIFFKLEESYKDFSIYIDGLTKLYEIVNKKYNNYHIRLFINESIYKDQKIMNRIKELNKIELVLFKPLNSKLVGLFPTLIRFFPMFDFPNNDSNVVIPIDIDEIPNYIIDKFNSIKDKVSNDIIKDTYLIKTGNLTKNILYKYNSLYKNVINIYSLAQSLINIKKINNSVIINFVNKIKNTKNFYTYYKHFKYDDKQFDIKMNQTKPFVYGIDEYFINDTLTKYLINKKLLMINNIKWDLFGQFYYIIKRNYLSLTKSNITVLQKIFSFILNKINYKIKKESVEELFNIIDKLVYSDKNKEVIKIIYQIFLENYNNKKLKFIYPSDIKEIMLKPEYKNLYEFEKIIFVNSKYSDIILNQKKI